MNPVIESIDINIVLNLITLIVVVVLFIRAMNRTRIKDPIIGYVIIRGEYVHHNNTLEDVARKAPGRFEIVTQPPKFVEGNERVYALDTFGKIILIHLPHGPNHLTQDKKGPDLRSISS